MPFLDCEIEKLADAVAAAIGQRPAPRAFRNALAAEYIGIGPETLTAWRSQGVGPKYRRIGNRVIYLKEELDAFLDALPVGGAL